MTPHPEYVMERTLDLALYICSIFKIRLIECLIKNVLDDQSHHVSVSVSSTLELFLIMVHNF